MGVPNNSPSASSRTFCDGKYGNFLTLVHNAFCSLICHNGMPFLLSPNCILFFLSSPRWPWAPSPLSAASNHAVPSHPFPNFRGKAVKTSGMKKWPPSHSKKNAAWLKYRKNTGPICIFFLIGVKPLKCIAVSLPHMRVLSFNLQIYGGCEFCSYTFFLVILPQLLLWSYFLTRKHHIGMHMLLTHIIMVY